MREATHCCLPIASNRVENINMQIEYDRKVLLGQGGFGSVFLGKYDNRKVAVKRVQLHEVNDNEEKALQCLQQFGHPNIVKLLHSELNADFKYNFLLNYEKKIRNDIHKSNFLCFSL